MQLPAKLLHQSGHVVADGLGETGGRHPDEAGAILVHDVFEALLEVGAAAIDGMLLPQGRGRNVHGLPEMADDVAPHIGGAPLGAVEKGHRPFNPPEGQAGPQRLAQLAGVGGGSIWSIMGFHFFIPHQPTMYLIGFAKNIFRLLVFKSP